MKALTKWGSCFCVLFVVALARPAFALSVTGGDIPLPVLVVNGTPQVSWDGEYSDLLAADALAMCWTTQLDRGTKVSLGVAVNVLSLMEAAGCRTTCQDPTMTTPVDIAICAWLEGRQDPTCNINASSGAPAALDVSQIRSPQTTADYVLPTAASLGLSGTSADTVRNIAQGELANADLALCVAEQLRDKLDTVQVAFASSDDLARVQELVRTNSTNALRDYSLIADTLASTQPAPTVVNSLAYFLAPFALWAPTFPADGIFGNDFAKAIGDLIEATDATIQLQLRDPTAQDSLVTLTYTVPPGSQSGPAFGMTGPRANVLANILYEGVVFGARSNTKDTTAPQVGVLLGLARQANALQINLSGAQVFRATSADNLWLTVENFLRTADCQLQNIPTSSCTLGFVGMPTSDSVLYQKHRITAAHAQTLMDALIEAVFGPPAPGVRGSPIWAYGTGSNSNLTSLFVRGSADFSESFGPAEAMGLHLFGHHTFSGDPTAAAPSGTVTIDPAFNVASLHANDLQALRTATTLQYRDINPSGDAFAQEGVEDGVGSSSWLAIAREALLTASDSTGSVQSIYTNASSAIPQIEQAIGTRQVIIRHTLQGADNSTACAGCVLFSQGPGLNVDVLTSPADTFTSAAVIAGVPLAGTLAADPGTTTIFGMTQASAIASQTFTTMNVKSYAANSNYVLRSIVTPTAPNTASDFKSTVLLSSPTTAAFQHVYTGNLNSDMTGTIATFGGALNSEVEKAFRFEPTNWSAPQFDGFGLPKHFTPAPDASLLGDSSGVSVEQHFINRASTAASDSTAALQQAFNTLEQQETDQASLDAANAKAAQLTAIQEQSLCGAQAPCSVTYVQTLPNLPNCTGSLSNDSSCQTFLFVLGNIVGAPPGASGQTVPLEADVAEALAEQATAPTFDSFSGGTLQGLLLNEWNAWNSLENQMNTGVATVETAIDQLIAADADTNAAQADYASVQADVNAAYAQVTAQDATFAAQQQQFAANQTQYQAQLDAAQKTVQQECSDNAFKNAWQDGFSWSGDDGMGVQAGGGPNGVHATINNFKNKSWSGGPLGQQLDRCATAQTAQQEAITALGPEKDAMKALSDALQKQIDASQLQFTALNAHLDAATAHQETAFDRQAAAAQGVNSQVAAALQSAQDAFGRLLASVVAIDEAFGQAQVAEAKIAVDQAQAQYDVRTRFGVRTRFHSFDLFRARALTENARRLAVAARRAIEERYVVDLSTMKAPEPFVDAPSLWANDVYSFDLKPPFAVGLTERPAQATGTYANALTDYVGNLQLFLDGFTVQRPTAAVVADAEVVQLPAPAAQVVSSASGTTVSFIDPASMGWSFFCPDSGTWVAHPNATTFATGSLTSTLSTVCNGNPPTLARLGFWLDPWGRLRGSIGDPPPFVSRYNVRMGDLAVNLVGSGIRNCQLAPDPSVCFAEPFIRYDLQQVGPVLVTDFDETWKSIDIPMGVIEGGKGLTAEEFLDPVTNGFNRPDVTNVARMEFRDRPIGGAYELTLYLPPEVRVEAIQRVQILTQTAYWVRQ